MVEMVLLRHDLPDGSHHFDWLIDRLYAAPGQNLVERPSDPEERSLLAFRVSVRIDLPKIRQFVAQRLPDHRRHYLVYQGPIGDGKRGSVVRLAAGDVRKIDELGGSTQVDPSADCGGSLSIRGRFRGQNEYVWAGMPQVDAAGLPSGLWVFVRSAKAKVSFDRRPRAGDSDGSASSDLGTWGLTGSNIPYGFL